MATVLDLRTNAFTPTLLMQVTLAWAAVATLAPSGAAQLQFTELSQHLPAYEDSSRSATLGDVDGDGDLDLIFANNAQNRLYLNDGAGLFTDATSSRLPTDDDNTVAVALGDVDGDGDADLVFGNYVHWDGSQRVAGHNRLYLNDGAGSFTDATAGRLPPFSDATLAMALGDVDGDGDPDLVLGTYRQFDGIQYFGGQNRLYLNDGSGVFADATSGRMPTHNDDTTAVALGDVDGDGDADLVFGNYGVQNRLYVNNGSGTFTDTTAVGMPSDSDETFDVALGDVDRDGDLDLVFANRRAVNHLYLNNGSGTFSDGTVGRLRFYADDTLSVALGDMDGDGHADLVFGNGPPDRIRTPERSTGQNRFYLSKGFGSFAEDTVVRMPTDRDETLAVVMGDVDSDGHPDLVLANGSGQNRLYLNDGRGAFADGTAPRMRRDMYDGYGVAMGDVDGDGDNDLIWGIGSTRDRLYLNDGTGTFTDATDPRMPTDVDNALAVALGDVDGDGDLDAIFASFQARIYVNDGTGTFTDATASRMPRNFGTSTALALGDVDGDTDLDLVLANFGERNRLYLNDGTGTFTDATTTHMPPNSDDTFAVAMGDVDGDGDNDLVFGTQRLTQYPLYLNDGAGFFTDATAGRMPVHSGGAFAVAMGDVDKDGDNDLVFGSDRGMRHRLYLNDGAGSFTDATAGRMPPDTDFALAVVLGDVDEDGDQDLVFGNKATQNRLYLNDGAGTFTDATARIPRDSDETYAVVLGDVDDDGDNDLVFGNYQRPNHLHLNLHRQVHTPLLPMLSRTFTMDFYARPGYGTSSHTAIPALSLDLAAMPLSFPPLGNVYLDPNGIINLPRVSIPASTGKGTLTVTVPLVSALVGVTFYVQALIVNDAQPVGDVHLTGYTTDLIIK